MGRVRFYTDDPFPQRDSQRKLRGENSISPWLKMQFALKNEERKREKRAEFEELMNRLRAGKNTVM